MVEYTNLEEEDELGRPGEAELERRMWPTAGKIEFEGAIGGIDIRSVGLHTLRKIALLPRSPFLPQGTIRENLDPQEECTDPQIAAILRDGKIYTKMSESDKEKGLVPGEALTNVVPVLELGCGAGGDSLFTQF